MRNPNLLRHRALKVLFCHIRKTYIDKLPIIPNIDEYILPVSDLVAATGADDFFLRKSLVPQAYIKEIDYKDKKDGVQGIQINDAGMAAYVDKKYLKQYYAPLWNFIDKIVKWGFPAAALIISIQTFNGYNAQPKSQSIVDLQREVHTLQDSLQSLKVQVSHLHQNR